MTASLQWMNDALCRQVGTEFFFPDKDLPSPEAIQVCKMCTVRNECLEYALTIPGRVQGIWGGTTERERRTLSSRVA